jgi:choline dehydrogenase-like flavoprotein
VIQTTKELPGDFPFNLDMNSGEPLGVGMSNSSYSIQFLIETQTGWIQSTIGGGERSSSATGYLAPVIQRPNLDVLLHAQVSRVVDVTRKGGKPSFGGVEFRFGP